MSPKLCVGDHVHARWRGNGCYYGATLTSVDAKSRTVNLAWDDGDPSDIVVDFREVVKQDEDVHPSKSGDIEKNTIVKEVPGKGRCLFTKNAVSSGDVIFIEGATLVAIPSKNQQLWDRLEKAHNEENFVLGTITFHYAALLSIFELSDPDLQIILDKFVPDNENDEIPEDITRILKKIQDLVPRTLPNTILLSSEGVITGALLQRLTNAWRYNSFGHHTEDGLVLYNRISMCAHGCDPSCCWTYGDNDSFVLRSRIALNAGQELTISYLQDEDLLKSTDVRRKKLENWKFTCGCERCMIKIDRCRGWRCLKCRSGAHYYVENLTEVDNSANGSTSTTSANGKGEKLRALTDCDVCAEKCKQQEIEQCLQLEPEYITRIEGLDKNNISDVEIVYNAALDFFHEHHWCVFVCETMLYDYYKGRDISIAIHHQDRKILYHSKCYPRPTFIYAWALEELADNICKLSGYQEKQESKANGTSLKENSGAGMKPSRLSECINLYRKAQSQLGILCGPSHPYAIAPQNKWHVLQQKFTKQVQEGA